MINKLLAYTLCLALLAACGDPVERPLRVDRQPDIYPDYCGVTIPATIAPLNFQLADSRCERMEVLIQGKEGATLQVNDRYARFEKKAWRQLLARHKGDSLQVTVSAKQEGQWITYAPFALHVSPDSIDQGLVYRKIAPGYEVYSRMGIYERDLSSFEENTLVENTLVKGMCVNCHAFKQTDPDYLSLHVRGAHGATYLRSQTSEEYLDTQTPESLSSCVYPYWHPDGTYIAYSTNTTRQSFHTARNERIEVVDLASDIWVYHPTEHRLLSCDALTRKDRFETFPAFSSDGKSLYFCVAEAKPIPEAYREIRYNLCKIDFNPATGQFGQQVDTLVQAEKMGKSVSFPRPSYDGRYVMFTLSDYGNFSIWHKEADLWLLDLRTGALRALDEINSEDTESFHNWSANSRWCVFSSRRGDGLYTRLYLAHVAEDGSLGKPFLLPQEDPWKYYDRSVYSYNVPAFSQAPIKLDIRSFEQKLTAPERTQVSSHKQQVITK